jgi:hypothetical protein
MLKNEHILVGATSWHLRDKLGEHSDHLEGVDGAMQLPIDDATWRVCNDTIKVVIVLEGLVTELYHQTYDANEDSQCENKDT